MTPVLLFGALLAVVAGFALLVRNNEGAKVRRALRAQARVPIAHVVEGAAAKIAGKVIAIETLPAPITRRPCVFWEIAAEELQTSRDSDGNEIRSWAEILRRCGGVPFQVDDGTMRAHVDPAEAQALLTADTRIGWEEGGDLEDWGPAFLARHGISAVDKRLRYFEGIVEAGEVVAVAGHGVREPDRDPRGAGAGYRDGPAIRLVLSGTTEHPLLISDRPDTTA